ncbi:transcriptional regulator, LacI family [Beutenbergia cavernae DSM 12333]|uniref:Transcriptional regulator, LacI family n=1 Tax=Beutenbergia cavernae (strain ATCC BAA-8 / DSM 12333 / CCUG 43141 / JCM 11478 / NBRC 16432 / NCIMB 13614 / HKI 0122) TaxID=471853 RepID=C5C4L4_BEUC1|nr:LacI family DNA-binding transcriptional regulator [Beutenbergia cavernae]ACQ82138.1 transcriptional regulator, LacI family [Beutenbergia cavernae DSM 12333]
MSAVRPTLQDVAARAGVSMKTVSNVINDFPHVKAATRERVERAIAELGYRPNLAARNVALGRSGTIALVVPQLDMPYFASLAMHVLEAAEERAWFVLIVQTRGSAEVEQRVLRGDFPQRIDGVIFSPLRVSPEEIAARSDTSPLVLLGDKPFRGIADHVAIDNVGAASLAVGHLLELGRTRVAMVGASLDDSVNLRRDGYLATMRAHGLAVEPERVVPVESNRGEAGESVMGDVLDRAAALGRPVPDAVFCSTDWLALGVIHALHRRGFRVPDDVAVVGFDDIPYGRVSSPTLTTIASSRDQIARIAVERLASRQKDAPEPLELAADYELVVRESTAGRQP